MIKLSFHKLLKIAKALKHFRFMAQKINLGKLAVIINKANIIIVPSN